MTPRHLSNKQTQIGGEMRVLRHRLASPTDRLVVFAPGVRGQCQHRVGVEYVTIERRESQPQLAAAAAFLPIPNVAAGWAGARPRDGGVRARRDGAVEENEGALEVPEQDRSHVPAQGQR